jgi:hypothetical protein
MQANAESQGLDLLDGSFQIWLERRLAPGEHDPIE